ncbi:MAG: hypothetical protein ACRDJ3_07765 [Solirubrobacteraceae bacterium]
MAQVPQSDSAGRSLGKTAVAVLVLLLAAWIVVKIVVGIVSALFFPILAVAAVVALIWAWRTLF